MKIMKPELFMKLALSFKAFGLSAKQAGEAFRKLGEAMLFGRMLDRKLRHRKRCALITFAMCQTCSSKKKYILWNLFKNVKL